MSATLPLSPGRVGPFAEQRPAAVGASTGAPAGASTGAPGASTGPPGASNGAFAATRSPLAALPGDASARLFAGPPAGAGAESLHDHLARLGPLPLAVQRAGAEDRSALLAAIEASGLRGRGGGEFPMARKLAAASRAGGTPIVVVNAAEGEPASRKDRALLQLRPHLVLDGAAVAAAACGAEEIVLFLRPEVLESWPVLGAEVEARRHLAPQLPIFVVASPGSYVAGESTAVVRALEARPALPYRHTVPVAVCGTGGQPTVVGNVETYAHLALLARFGPAWFGKAGSPQCPGSSLVTLAGDVAAPGLVAELLAPMPGAQLLAELGGLATVPQAVLVGGYSGRWVNGAEFWAMPLDRGMLGSAGIGLGCGIVAPLGAAACGLAMTWRLLGYLAGQSAGQCSPCRFGLPALAAELDGVLAGRHGRRALVRLHRRTLSIAGQGACGHPDGAIALLESALSVFADDLEGHLRGRGCGGTANGGWFPAQHAAPAAVPAAPAG
ncbi:MAG TPA: NADH-ubiquinone oxidoreductase-F iron-sulfur binding region domain-containing protein [Acidimicrobiales bacterium]|nr:NADH-ubiquinone oxidoreductase-F iron-sulfur binding region domain-containing protein [Acidimicrobiales bacterium]